MNSSHLNHFVWFSSFLWGECELNFSHSHHFVDIHASCEETESYEYLQNDKNVRSSAHSLLTSSMIIYGMMRMWGVELTASSPHHFVANQGPLRFLNKSKFACLRTAWWWGFPLYDRCVTHFLILAYNFIVQAYNFSSRIIWFYRD